MELKNVRDGVKIRPDARLTQPREQLFFVHLIWSLVWSALCLTEHLYVLGAHPLPINYPAAHRMLVGRRARSASNAHAHTAEHAKLELFLDDRAIALGVCVAQALKCMQSSQLTSLCSAFGLTRQ